ncbi:unnamed protein product [Gongylonema pulchrum]|uniref:Uncharacterized protein n=1 Tax=Gongylonema pulchrum TaxID=637853 RepID=A0A183E889_9BILA|nr:unnamed protein product [Gongylonema pulchrum]
MESIVDAILFSFIDPPNVKITCPRWLKVCFGTRSKEILQKFLLQKIRITKISSVLFPILLCFSSFSLFSSLLHIFSSTFNICKIEQSTVTRLFRSIKSYTFLCSITIGLYQCDDCDFD